MGDRGSLREVDELLDDLGCCGRWSEGKTKLAGPIVQRCLRGLHLRRCSRGCTHLPVAAQVRRSAATGLHRLHCSGSAAALQLLPRWWSALWRQRGALAVAVLLGPPPAMYRGSSSIGDAE
jgi:hypothetical protein